MVDICMCYEHEDCPLADKCFRAKATPDEYQSYADFYSTDADCAHYWKVNTKEEVDELNREWTD